MQSSPCAATNSVDALRTSGSSVQINSRLQLDFIPQIRRAPDSIRSLDFPPFSKSAEGWGTRALVHAQEHVERVSGRGGHAVEGLLALFEGHLHGPRRQVDLAGLEERERAHEIHGRVGK